MSTEYEKGRREGRRGTGRRKIFGSGGTSRWAGMGGMRDGEERRDAEKERGQDKEQGGRGR
jgi:hypothetical protein